MNASDPAIAGRPACMPVPCTGAQALIWSLEAVGAELVFGIPGGMILPSYDLLLDSARLRHVLCGMSREQGMPRRDMRWRRGGQECAWLPRGRGRQTW